MKNDKLVDAIGMISDDKIENAKAPSAKIYKFYYKKAFAIAAIIILCLTISFPVMSATVEPVYQIVYKISPSLAQSLKPVRLTSIDNGIKMEVVSAAIYENEAVIYISLQDLTDQNRIDETTDLFDSYRINRAFDSSASCSMAFFDNETKTATFLITISQWNDKKIDGDKITFYFTQFLSSKSKFDGKLTELNLSNISEATQTQQPKSFRGGSVENSDYESRYDIKYLVPLKDGIYSPVDGVTITNIGFVDNKLHIQLYFEDILSYDNHGYINMIDKNGNEAKSFHVSFWDDETIGSYQEIIYDISPKEISNYDAYGNFVTCKNLNEGYWQVTFPLENMK